jgi:hypothetical protein
MYHVPFFNMQNTTKINNATYTRVKEDKCPCGPGTVPTTKNTVFVKGFKTLSAPPTPPPPRARSQEASRLKQNQKPRGPPNPIPSPRV